MMKSILEAGALSASMNRAMLSVELLAMACESESDARNRSSHIGKALGHKKRQHPGMGVLPWKFPRKDQ
jgi:hypothetical protein